MEKTEIKAAVSHHLYQRFSILYCYSSDYRKIIKVRNLLNIWKLSGGLTTFSIFYDRGL